MRSLVNGESGGFVSVSDRGLQYGDGVFRTLLYVNGTVIDLPLHMEKLAADASRLDIQMPADSVWMRDLSTLARDISGPAVIKLVLTRGESARGYRYAQGAAPTRIATVHPAPIYPESYWEEGIKLYLCESQWSIQPRLAGVKHLNRLEQVLARNECPEDCAEGLMCNLHGQVISGTMSNVFLVANSEIITPELGQSGIDGMMRGRLIQLAEKENLTLKVDHVSLELLREADEVFLTNSLIGIWPVREFQGHIWRRAEMARHLQEQLNHPRLTNELR